jgi:hypothetical protein
MTQYAYTWEIDGKKALNPEQFQRDAEGAGFDIGTTEPMIVIRTSRGSIPSISRMLMAKADADAILSAGSPVTIKVTEYAAEDSGGWNARGSLEFRSFYPLRCSTAFGLDQRQVILELADAKYALANKHVRKKFNLTIRQDTDEAGTDEILDPQSTYEGEPWTYQEILEKLLDPMDSPPEVTIPGDFDAPRNLVFECSVADAVEQLLASIGMALVHDPFEDEWQIIELSEDQDLQVLEEAEDDGRLTVTRQPVESELLIPQAVLVRPMRIADSNGDAGLLIPIEGVIEPEASGRIIAIDDHEFEPDTGRIADSVAAWYGEANDDIDNQFFGILRIAPGSKITHCEWFFSDEGTATRVRRMIDRDIPWPKQPQLVRGIGLIRFTLEEDLLWNYDSSPEYWPRAAAIINTEDIEDPDNEKEIVVTAVNTRQQGRKGDRGIAWVVPPVEREEADPELRKTRYYVLQLADRSELVRFELTADLVAGATSAEAKIIGETDPPYPLRIQVSPWLRLDVKFRFGSHPGNQAPAGTRGFAWRTTLGTEEKWWIIALGSYLDDMRITANVNFPYGTPDVGFNDPTPPDPIPINNIKGINKRWTGDAEYFVDNPDGHKLWNGCKIRAEWNQDTEKFEVYSATADKIIHSVSQAFCTFKRNNGANGNQAWEIGSDANWVVSVSYQDCQIKYTNNCGETTVAGELNFVKEVRMGELEGNECWLVYTNCEKTQPQCGSCTWVAADDGNGGLMWVPGDTCPSGCTCFGPPSTPPTSLSEVANSYCVFDDEEEPIDVEHRIKEMKFVTDVVYDIAACGLKVTRSCVTNPSISPMHFVTAVFAVSSGVYYSTNCGVDVLVFEFDDCKKPCEGECEWTAVPDGEDNQGPLYKWVTESTCPTEDCGCVPPVNRPVSINDTATTGCEETPPVPCEGECNWVVVLGGNGTFLWATEDSCGAGCECNPPDRQPINGLDTDVTQCIDSGGGA